MNKSPIEIVKDEDIKVPEQHTKAMDYLSSDEIKDRHLGEDIFILGNGPSLKEAIKYKKQLENNICISIYVSHWLVDCEYVLYADMGKLDVSYYEELLSFNSYIYTVYHPDVSKWFNKYKQRVSFDGILSESIDDPLYNGGNSLFVAINLAYIMGAKRIIMIGCDMNNEKHFYDDMPEFHNTPFYKKFKPLNEKRNPTGSKRYRGTKANIPCLKNVEKFLNNKKVKLINCSEQSVLCGEKIKLEKVLKND